MAITLDASAADFESRFTAFLSTKREVSEDVDAAVRQIIATVRAGGDATISYRTDGPEPRSCAVVEQFDRYVGFSYCVNDAGVVTAFAQGDDYAVELADWSTTVADADFAPPFPVR